MDGGEQTCRQCQKKSVVCKWDQELEKPTSTARKQEDGMENIYETMFHNRQNQPQFVCSTQPLSLLLSSDSYLCFDGDFFGLYYPWRGLDNTNIKDTSRMSAFKKFIDSQGAYIVPPVSEQNRLIRLYLDNLYPIYPIISREVVKNTSKIPLLLLNAIMLCASRFDTGNIRSRLKTYYDRCKLLELVEQDKIVLIQSFLLMSVHEEGISGASDSKEYITKACNLCGELCITNISGANVISDLGGSQLSSFVKLQYSKGLLRRLFWISFSLDRLISATSGREMYYDRQDLIVEELTIDDFEPSESQVSDLVACRAMLSLGSLVERVQCSLYRPPAHRSVDTNLKEDILNWKLSGQIRPEVRTFLKIYHAYVAILTFRCLIDTVGLILQKGGGGTASLDTESFPLREYSKRILTLAQSSSIKHHVLVVHAVLHVIALNQLERNADSSAGSKLFHGEVREMAKDVLMRLEKSWWFAGAALRLCTEIWRLEAVN